jgi:PST family polysaccharide transporter
MEGKDPAQTILSRIRRSVLCQNIIALYGVQSVNYLLPLITIPYLTRVLKPEGWGSVAFVQSLGMIAIMIVEYGFTLSASRRVSTRRHDREWLGSILASVTGAKFFLVISSLSVIVWVSRWIPRLHDHPQLFYAGLFWAAAQGLSPLWFFQGLERLRLTSSADIVCKVAGVIAILLTVRNASQDWVVLLIYGCASLASTSYMYLMALRDYRMSAPSVGDIAAVMKDGAALFMFQASVSMYTSANVFVLGLFVPPHVVGIYAGAERITKSILGLLGPINQAIYPRINAIIHENFEAGRRTIRRAFWMVFAFTMVIAATIEIAAPLLVRILLGSRFHESIVPLRLLAVLVPIIGASNMLGVQWMIPLRRDKAFNVIVITSGILNICLATLLARRFSSIGMAIAVVCAELCVTTGCYVYLSIHRLNPLRFANQTEALTPLPGEFLGMAEGGKSE